MENIGQDGQSDVSLFHTLPFDLFHQDRLPYFLLINYLLSRPLSTRYNEGGIHRRPYNLYDRGSKTTRGATHRTSRLSTNQRQSSPQNNDGEK